jgi:hypothetical protein
VSSVGPHTSLAQEVGMASSSREGAVQLPLSSLRSVTLQAVVSGISFCTRYINSTHKKEVISEISHNLLINTSIYLSCN